MECRGVPPRNLCKWNNREFELTSFRKVIHDSSTQRKSIHYQSPDPRPLPSPISSANHVSQICPTPPRPHEPSPTGVHLWSSNPNGEVEIQPSTPHRYNTDMFFKLTTYFGVRRS
ncbi:hypothetical protein AVEN_254014-1 [Araneus ventricosus]|uniref:Uncharacterized protein n=1 Tax=Araneus ventricosus TaxID=182803 RepID=A0A4Y2E889_ARAVE|nr:hypothetical protein AVEN_254014-1 [Araneus ventricosus]